LDGIRQLENALGPRIFAALVFILYIDLGIIESDQQGIAVALWLDTENLLPRGVVSIVERGDDGDVIGALFK